MRTIVIIAVACIFAGSAFADTVYFKNGTKIETEQAWEEGDYVKCLRFGGTVAYSKADVLRIESGLTQEQAEYNEYLREKNENGQNQAETKERNRIKYEKYVDENLEKDEAAGYGNPPENYEKAIKAHLNEYLFDPYSIRELSIDPPKDLLIGRFRIGGLKPGQIVWYCDVRYNAKNRYGAYTGKKSHRYFFRGEEIIEVSD